MNSTETNADREKAENEVRKPLDPQLLFDRSRISAFDLLKTVVSLATGSVAVYFVALTKADNHELSGGQEYAAKISMLLMVFAVFAGLAAWSADARFYNIWAHSLDKEKTPGRLWNQRNLAGKIRIVCLCILVVSFFGGVVAAAWYVWLSASGKS
jgi:hypothetical protein